MGDGMTRPLADPVADIRGLVALLRTVSHVDAARMIADALQEAINTRDLKPLAATLGLPMETLPVPTAARGKAEREMKIRGILAELYGDLDLDRAAHGMVPLDITAAARAIVAGMGRYEASSFSRNESAGSPPWTRPARSYHELLQLHVRRADTGQRTPSEGSVRHKLYDLRDDGKIRHLG